MNEAMPIKTMIELTSYKFMPVFAAWLYSFTIPDVFLWSLFKSLIVAVIVKVILLVATPEIKKISIVIRTKLDALKRLRNIKKQQKKDK